MHLPSPSPLPPCPLQLPLKPAGTTIQEAAKQQVPGAIEMPASWVPRLQVPRDLLDTRVPKGTKKVVYQYSEHEIFALFGEAAKFDGCTERLTIFSDTEHQCKVEVRVS